MDITLLSLMLMKAILINLIMQKLVSKELFPVRYWQGLCIHFVAVFFFMKYRFLAVESLPFHRIKSKVNKLENFLLLWPNYCIFNVRYFEQDILQLLFFFFYK